MIKLHIFSSKLEVILFLFNAKLYRCCLLELIVVVNKQVSPVYTVSSLCTANQQYVLDSLKPHWERAFGVFEIVSDKMCTTAINLKFGYYVLYLVFNFLIFFIHCYVDLRDRDRMVVRFTTTCTIGVYHY